MNNKLLSLGACALLLLAGTAAPAGADLVVVAPSPAAVGAALYDALGIPIWGYGPQGRAIYAYSPEGLPIYAYNRVCSGCYVPNWGFHPSYHGPRHPHGCHLRPHGFRPGPPPPPPRHIHQGPGHKHHGSRPHAPRPPQQKMKPHGPQGPRPASHARPASGAHRVGQGPMGHQPGPRR